MNDIALPEHIRTCVIAGARDAPEYVAALAGALQRHYPLRVTVLVYTPRAPLAPFPRFVGPVGEAGLGAVGMGRSWFPGAYLKLAFASHAPTLFCAEIAPWERVILAESAPAASGRAPRVLPERGTA